MLHRCCGVVVIDYSYPNKNHIAIKFYMLSAPNYNNIEHLLYKIYKMQNK